MSISDEIKQRIDLVELIGSYVPLTKAGANYKGLCPFHSEKTPSFVVFPETQTWHCFGSCGTGGDLFTFIMRRERLEFPEALRMLAERAGVQLAPPSPRQQELQHEFEELWQANASAAAQFHRWLREHPAAAEARGYLERRGVTEASIARFQLGYALDDWHALELALTGHSQTNLLDAGLLICNENGSVYDRFRGRLMFPIHDPQGHVVGFGGRVLDDSQPKYLNTPQTPVFDKGRLLYGLHLARPAIRDSAQAIVVEGYMDVVIPHQEGIRNVVAVMGTSLSDNHIDALKNVRDLVLALDPDIAGLRATERGYGVASAAMEREVVPVPTAEGLIRYEERLAASIRVLELPDGRDPDELVRSDRARWDALVAEAPPVVQYFINKTYQQADLTTAHGKRAAVQRMLGFIATLGNSIERSHYLQQISELFRTDERQLRNELEALRRAPRVVSAPPAPREQKVYTDPILEQSRRCLGLLLSDLSAARDVLSVVELDPEMLHDERDRQVLEAIYAHPEADQAEELIEPDGRFDSELRDYVESLRQACIEPQGSPDSFREDLFKTVLRLKRSYLAQQILQLQYAQVQVHQEGSAEQLREIVVLTDQVFQALRAVDQAMLSITYSGRRSAQGQLVNRML
ncbi:MAG: DNA primase [Chloroflexi bacterium]|nr:DNA primase [Chloroflexota bacterium]